MPADLLGPEARHQPDDQAARDRNENRAPAQRPGRDRQVGEREPAVVRQVGTQGDQAQQGPGGAHAGQADGNGQRHQQDDAAVGGEIAQAGGPLGGRWR
ncbi:hypothetical protein G6F68_019679 [Rhizopus microsporus]|nr:hypothetical protein G6F68_019679 [Rhizopus microsporus]